MEYGQCNGATKSSCSCINGVPNDGQFCQPLHDMSNGSTCPTPPPPPAPPETPKNMSLKIDEKFDIALTNPTSVKYHKYKTTLENVIDDSYRNMAGYKPGSVRILRFRPGSVNVDFIITTTTNDLDFRSANSELSQILTANGFKVVENAFAYSEEYDLVQSPGKIYPLQDVQLNCALPAAVMGNIQWRVGGVDPFLNPVKYNILNNNRTLKVISASAVDSGIYECITQNNSLRLIQWQRIVIQPYPNIQVNPDKVYKCGDVSIPLQCCAHSSYTVKWTKDSPEPLTPPGPGSGCIVYNYTVQKQDCEAGDKKVTFTCQLSDDTLSVFDYSSKSLSISTTQKAFTCTDSSFGVGIVNQTAFRHCDGNEIGIQWAVCNKTGQWSIISNNCTLRAIQDLAERAEYLDVEEVPMFAANLSNAAEKNSEGITTVPVNLLKVVDLLSRLATISKTGSFTVDKNMMEDFLKTVDVVTSEKAQATWKSFNDGDASTNASSVLLQAIENIGSSLSNDSFSIVMSNIRLVRNLSRFIHETFNTNSTTQIRFPETGGSFPVTVVIFSALNVVLPVRNANNNSSQTQASINGDLVVIEGESAVNNVSLVFDAKNKSLGNPQCVFWNFNLLNGIGAWDSTGCELKPLSSQAERLTCECNHTTSFSILMSPAVFPDNDTLTYITYIGVCISMGSLVLCLIIESLIWKSMSKTDTSYIRHVSTVNIALSLLVADMCFIIGAVIGKKGQKTPVGPCSTVTFFIHFFYLALFFWMLLSALLLLYRTVIVFSRMSRTMMMTIAFTVGYGAPLIIALVTVAATSGNGGYIQEEDTCWLNWNKTKAILAFVIPALVIVLVNLLVLIMIVYKIMTSGIGARIQRDEKHAIVMIARCVGILTPLFGLTWGFGIGTMVSSAFGIHVVFAILNSLQGFFILVFGTLLDKKIFGALLRRWRWTNMSLNLTGNTSEGTSASNRRGFYHVFPRRYGYNLSTAAYSSHVPSNFTESFKFTDK
ncbi:adhesion G protein-coupled receptor F5 isoform X2 [Ictalurus furcatus]|nr:adhesion G protein-coupled receptor F5 isoform X2 [Ictalurus furcatus]